MARNTTTISIDTSAAQAIDARSRDGETRSTRLVQDLTDYHALLEAGLRRARKILSPAEAMLILDAQNGAHQAPAHWLGERLAMQVDDSIKLDGTAERYGVDGPALVAKLQAIGDMANVALVDWAAKVWDDPDTLDQATLIFKGESNE